MQSKTTCLIYFRVIDMNVEFLQDQTKIINNKRKALEFCLLEFRVREE